MKKRIGSLFLVLALCFTLLPTAAFAAEADFTVTNAGGALNPNPHQEIQPHLFYRHIRHCSQLLQIPKAHLLL